MVGLCGGIGAGKSTVADLLAGHGARVIDVDALGREVLTHDDVRADHQRVVGLGGWGVPTLVFPGAEEDESRKLFGPVLIDPPTGDAALRLWDLMVGWLEFPHLFEVQRPKTPGDLAEVAEVFRPYLEARDWQAVANPTP